MPIYEFSCETCGEVFERILTGNAHEARCPSCGSNELARLVSGFAARTRIHRRGGVVDLSSNACPCGAHHKHHAGVRR